MYVLSFELLTSSFICSSYLLAVSIDILLHKTKKLKVYSWRLFGIPSSLGCFFWMISCNIKRQRWNMSFSSEAKQIWLPHKVWNIETRPKVNTLDLLIGKQCHWTNIIRMFVSRAASQTKRLLRFRNTVKTQLSKKQCAFSMSLSLEVFKPLAFYVL